MRLDLLCEVGGCLASPPPVGSAEGCMLLDVGAQGVVAVPSGEGGWGGAGRRGLVPALVDPHIARMRLNHIIGWRLPLAGREG